MDLHTDSQINKARHTIREQTDLFTACCKQIPKDPFALERFMNAHNWFWNGRWWVKDALFWSIYEA